MYLWDYVMNIYYWAFKVFENMDGTFKVNEYIDARSSIVTYSHVLDAVFVYTSDLQLNLSVDI